MSLRLLTKSSTVVFMRSKAVPSTAVALPKLSAKTLIVVMLVITETKASSTFLTSVFAVEVSPSSALKVEVKPVPVGVAELIGMLYCGLKAPGIAAPNYVVRTPMIVFMALFVARPVPVEFAPN